PVTRFNVPPKPTAILDGSFSRKFGMHAPSPTLSPLNPEAIIVIVHTCSNIAYHGTRRSRPLKTMSDSAMHQPPRDEKANSPQRRRSRGKGSRPRIQNFRPSRLIIGKMNRPVYEQSNRPMATRFKRLTEF